MAFYPPNIALESPPYRLEYAYDILFTPEALKFLTDLVTIFDERIDELYHARLQRKAAFEKGWQPSFVSSPERLDKTWTIAPLPERLLYRKLDLGDVSPSNDQHFIDSLHSDVRGIQVDFDDGHCPTWRNTISGLHNVYMATRGTLKGAPVDISKAPIMMLRPRAWNMIEHNCLINGKEVPGPIFDFGLLMFHCGKLLTKLKCGPFFYLSKIEYYNETALWNDIFVWTQNKLAIPLGTIKACVLIENILASFCLEEILYSLKEHSLGLNCGLWDYSASIICKFGKSRSFLIPDRKKYVNMDQPFLNDYLKLVVRTCHARNAPATGGMAALLLPHTKNVEQNKESQIIIEKVVQAKRKEIQAGADGFMVYDSRLVPYINKLWSEQCGAKQNQISTTIDSGFTISPGSLISLPQGGVTVEGLQQNISVAMLFIYHWFEGKGHYFLDGLVEDSATAEISRAQLWQWIRHAAPIEGPEGASTHVTRSLIGLMTHEVYLKYQRTLCRSEHDRKRLSASKYMLLEVVSMREPPEFITTYLNDNHKFRALHNKNDGLKSKL